MRLFFKRASDLLLRLFQLEEVKQEEMKEEVKEEVKEEDVEMKEELLSVKWLYIQKLVQFTGKAPFLWKMVPRFSKGS